MEEDSKQALSLVYDFSVLIGGYFLLVGLTVAFGGFDFKASAPFWALKAFKANWPNWWIGSLGGSVFVSALAFGFNPFRSGGEYGSAAWATERQIKKMKLRDKKGMIFGEKNGKYLRNNDALSAVIVAPPGSGKTAGLVVPSLVSCGDSMIVADLKPELYDLTAKRRAEFSKVLRFAPGEKESVQWNPLHKNELPEEWDDIVIHVERVARSMYTSDDANKDSYFTDEGRNTFILFALYLIHRDGQTSIAEVRAFALDCSNDMQAAIADILDKTPDLPTRVVEEGKVLIGKADREFSGIIGSFKNGLNVYADPRVAANTTGCDFRLSDLRKERTTLYLSIRDADARRLRPVIAMFCEFAGVSFMSKLPEPQEQTIVFMLDEFVRMSRLDEIIEMPALARGYRIRLFFVVQSWAQLTDLYGDKKADALKNTVGFLIFYTQNDDKMADMISRSIGPRTRKKLSFSTPEKNLVRNKSEANEGVPLILPQDILSMPQGEILILRQYQFKNPVRAIAPFWFKDKALSPHVTAPKR